MTLRSWVQQPLPLRMMALQAVGLVRDCYNGSDNSANTQVMSFTADLHASIGKYRGPSGTNGGNVRRLQYAQANVESQVSNLIAANGRIVDVDIAAESSNLAKQQVLVQAAASMTAQANVANDVALMLLQ